MVRGPAVADHRDLADYSDPLRARGLLLIDEIDLHLHPLWQRRIVSFLTKALPNLQIVVTTHSPLTVHQAGENELFVLRREEGQEVSVTAFAGAPNRLLLPQLLESPLFGLHTLDSPQVEGTPRQLRGLQGLGGARARTNQDDGQIRSIKKELSGVSQWRDVPDYLRRTNEVLERVAAPWSRVGRRHRLRKTLRVTAQPAEKPKLVIRLSRRRAASAIPAAFRQPKLAASAGKLIDIHFAAQTSGKYDFDSAAWKPAGCAKERHGRQVCLLRGVDRGVAHGDVEHFRPKSIYWWLAFAFDNYLFSCQICNQTFKGDRFPIRGAPVVAPLMPAMKPVGAALDQLVATLVLDASALTDAQLTTPWRARTPT